VHSKLSTHGVKSGGSSNEGLHLARSKAPDVIVHGGASEFAAPDYQRVFQHAALFKIAQKRGNRLVSFPAAVGKTA
jgi:hypothetical protein